eukprot:6186867-Pleurochrysis_carterae.AAC.1
MTALDRFAIRLLYRPTARRRAHHASSTHSAWPSPSRPPAAAALRKSTEPHGEDADTHDYSSVASRHKAKAFALRTIISGQATSACDILCRKASMACCSFLYHKSWRINFDSRNLQAYTSKTLFALRLQL